ncbi:methyltransferase type 11 [Halobiforma lacisalsi AJ5]|uniref:Methyltransferase type 11 n=1 Tax=Natronobacterium lacisalsi AJ5 TaxID=358396 RepID=M0LID0_NATLA|nr:class I SAM-dependent methyltransferase [Halobiforma lacisalsi]APW96472.1 methyltransferase type 11 [Halobiforma lacisalsi AJ5]EMA31755.1 type 11 methyltransferase [Halobiforma lacisalsi AJ5]
MAPERERGTGTDSDSDSDSEYGFEPGCGSESERPNVHRAFDALADEYDRKGDEKPANAHLERPATRSLVPDVDGARVLDAGCGAGHLTRELVDRGAAVVGLDASAEMLAYARERVPEAVLCRADLGRELPFAEGSFDGVVSSLAFHYVRDWGRLFRNLRRILEPGGWLVFSMQHPHADFEEYDDTENYHDVERVSAVWDSFGTAVAVPAYRRPLSAVFSPALETGFRLERLVEPTPTEAYRRKSPERYEYERTHPNFLCLRFSRPESESTDG